MPERKNDATPAHASRFDCNRRNIDSSLLLTTSFTVTADIDVPERGAEGMMLMSGGRFAGCAFYLLEGKPVWLWNLIDMERVTWQGPDALAPGKHIVEVEFKFDGLGPGTLAVNDFSDVGRSEIGVLKVDGDIARRRKAAQRSLTTA